MADRHGRLLDRFGDRPRRLGDAAGERAEVHRLEEGDEPRSVDLGDGEILDRRRHRHGAFEGDEAQRQARRLGVIDQRLATLGLLDLVGAGEQRLDVAVFVYQLRRGLDADARHARHVVDRITGQRLHVDDLVRRHAELLQDLGRLDPLVLHRVEHDDARLDQLHQVLVGGDDGHVGARRARLRRIGRDQVVGLEALLLDTGDVEGARRLADQAELRSQVLRRLRAMGLVEVVDLVAERVAGGVEDHREMGRFDPRRRPLRLLEEAEQHVAEARDGADRRPTCG